MTPSAPAAVPASPEPAPPQATQTQIFGGASSNAKLLNPDISLIGDFIGTAGRNTVSPSHSLEMHESEVGLQAIIDPYARADAFISFGETAVNIEEAYVTFTSLPAGLLLKVGKMRADFGIVGDRGRHVPTQQRRHGRRAARIRDMDHVDVGDALEHLEGDVLGGGGRDAGKGQFARLGARGFDQVGEASIGRVAVDRDDER